MSTRSSIEQGWSSFTIAFLGVAITLQLLWIAITPMECRYGPDVETPFATTAAVIRGTERDLVITIRADGSYFVGSTFVPAAKLAESLEAIQERHERS